MAADLVYESQELDSMEDIQEFCRRSLIPHVVVLSDKELFFERKQVKVRTLETSGKTSERIVGIAELVEFLQQRQGVDRSDSVEGQTSTRLGGPSNPDSFPSNVRPPVNVNVVTTSKLSGHFKRKIHDLVRNTFGGRDTLTLYSLSLCLSLLSDIDKAHATTGVFPLQTASGDPGCEYMCSVCE